MHPRNRYAGKHNFTELLALEPELGPHLTTTPDGRISLDFAHERAVYLLNRLLLRRDYGLEHWDIPAENLTPPLPGRLDYIHLLHDLYPEARNVLDVGTGASLIYPILGVGEYRWSFVGSEVDARSVRVASAIVKFNPSLRRKVEVRKQSDPGRIFNGIIREGERFDLTMCNPPFFESWEDALSASRKKWEQLGREDAGLNFGGADHELWTTGGEPGFLKRMIGESVGYRDRVGWFTSLVSRKGYLRQAQQELDQVKAKEVKVVEMEQGNKRTRVLAWKF